MPFTIRAAGKKTAEIFLYGPIGDMWTDGISAKQFADRLRDIGQVDRLNIRLNSEGGSVFDGVAIYNTLMRHPADVWMSIDGMALSIASVIAMAGDSITMADNALFMIHEPYGMVAGTAKDMREMANVLDLNSQNIIDTYAKRTRLPKEKIAALMAEETWMRAPDALSLGFVDEIAPELAIAACFDPKHFHNIPEFAKARMQERKSSALDLFRVRIDAMAKRAAELNSSSRPA